VHGSRISPCRFPLQATLPSSFSFDRESLGLRSFETSTLDQAIAQNFDDLLENWNTVDFGSDGEIQIEELPLRSITLLDMAYTISGEDEDGQEELTLYDFSANWDQLGLPHLHSTSNSSSESGENEIRTREALMSGRSSMETQIFPPPPPHHHHRPDVHTSYANEPPLSPYIDAGLCQVGLFFDHLSPDFQESIFDILHDPELQDHAARLLRQKLGPHLDRLDSSTTYLMSVGPEEEKERRERRWERFVGVVGRVIHTVTGSVRKGFTTLVHTLAGGIVALAKDIRAAVALGRTDDGEAVVEGPPDVDDEQRCEVLVSILRDVSLGILLLLLLKRLDVRLMSRPFWSAVPRPGW